MGRHHRLQCLLMAKTYPCQEVELDFIAKTAIYARTRAAMKDLPALLLAVGSFVLLQVR